MPCLAPEGPPALSRRAAFLILLLASALGVLPGCRPSEPPDPEEQALREALGLSRRQAIHRVILAGEGAREVVEPSRIEVQPGDVVVFETGDWRVHTLTFTRNRLSSSALEFMERTGQTESPPLVVLGSRFAVTFEDAPEASYPFRSQGGGGSADGVVEVRTPTGRR